MKCQLTVGKPRRYLRCVKIYMTFRKPANKKYAKNTSQQN